MMSSIAGAAVVAGLRGLAHPIISNVSSRASRYIGVDMVREMEDLETIILPQLDLIIASAESQSQHVKNIVQKWLRRLKDREWEQFLAPLCSAEFNKGIRILVTSRSNELPSVLNCRKTIALEDIEENDFLTFFRYYALGCVIIGDEELEEELQGIGDDIARKLQRSPLEAKAVASRLSRMLDVEIWKDARDSKQLDGNIMENLLWSYQHLGPQLVWKHDTYKNNNVDLEVLEGLEPSSRLNELAIEENLPSSLQYFVRCHSLALLNLTGLKKMSPLPENLTSLKFGGCSSLRFISKEEEEQGANSADATREEALQPLMRSTELETLTEILGLDGSELERFQACFQEHQYLVPTVSTRHRDVAQLVLPLTLRRLELSICNITDCALSDCLRSLTSLKELALFQITTLSALPSKQVMENLPMLSSVDITSCQSLCSVVGLGAIASLEKLAVSFCPSLELSESSILSSQLKELTVRGCTIRDGFLHDGLSKLVSLEIFKCRTPSVLQVSAWPSLKCLTLCDCLDVGFLGGLHALESLQDVQLVLPNLGADSFTGCKGNWKSLRIRTSSLLQVLLSVEGFAPPMVLTIEGCQESDFSLEGIPNLSSIIGLSFMNCKVQSISAMKDLTSLETLALFDCPFLRSLPELPPSVQCLDIFGCQILEKSTVCTSCKVATGEEDTPIGAMPGCFRLGWRHGLLDEVYKSRDVGVNSFVLFPKVPDGLKSQTGDEAYNDNGLVPRTIRLLKDKYPDIARAGADAVSPSDMMDGRVGAIRAALDAEGLYDVSIMSYTAKYASSFCGPFREALDSNPRFGDKKTYQMNPANYREALIETAADEAEGADILLVSGEYSMIKAGGVLKMVDEEKVMMESLLCLRRAGADIILTYFARQAANVLSGMRPSN
ncbi:hypothetical protein E2562_015381 [Oryza meyeriana var. granulata]|uniref:porphobilinogen synthase n=1 Tax=Oryza meyeriana var. granulata TaxID=110450 RepID=A0A6G1EK94_9ORYZ|nr:hypothetical protein E2562_015381 [Oryza meyeriana var. granulata]